jgi:hypothetical protein
MDESKLRAWWWHRQGLDGSLRGKNPADILRQSGWARSVEGVGPYVTLFARGGTSREEADAAVAELEIHELPAARGCTYVLPASDFAVGLTVAQAFGEGEMKTAAKLGVTEKEVDELCDAVLAALGDEPLDPDAIKALVGKAVRNLGEEGKKKGMITTLPLALGVLQARGLIRRVPVSGRLDQQRYKYMRWSPGPLGNSKLSRGDAFTEVARRFFRWVGPATMKEFQWFSGLGVKTANDAVASLGLVPADEGGDRLLLPDDAEAFRKLATPKDPSYALVSSLDAISAARRDVSTLVEESDRDAVSNATFGDRPGGSLVDLAAHAILDRGRLIGYWEYDVDTGRIVWATFANKKDKALQRTVDETQTYVREQLGDARSFSLDSPKSRRPKLDALARLTASLCLALLVAGCSAGDGALRLAPTRTTSMLACILALPKAAASTAQMTKSCEKMVPRLEFVGLDQLAIDRILAGTPGTEDPGIRAPCSGGDLDRTMSGVETMGYGVLMNGQTGSVTLVQPDKVVTYQRDGKTESVPVAFTSGVADSSVVPSACALAIAQALTVVSQCEGQQWAGRGCATMLTLMAYCPDPMRLMIDPDVGYGCQPRVDADAVKSAAMKACASRARSETPCNPEVAANGWLRDPGGICASPSAMVSADKQTCVVPLAVSGARGTAKGTALVIWGKTTSGGPVFTPEAAKSPGG